MAKFRLFRKKHHSDILGSNEKIRSQNKNFIIMAVVLLVGVGVGFGISRYSYDIVTTLGFAPKISELNTDSIKQTYATLKANYDGPIDDKKLLEAANSAMVQAVGDEYTVYMNKQTADAFNADLTGSIGSGIGIEMTLRADKLVVLRVLADNPALRAGMKAGDVITAVDGKSIAGLDLATIVTKIRGPTGSQVGVTVDRDGKPIDFTMTRETINNQSVDSFVKDGVGVIRILRFDEKTGELAREAAKKLLSQGVKGIVIDLRNNGGGYVSSAKDVASLWLDDKVIMTERTGDTIIDTIKSGRNSILGDTKTVVLINASTASASEILAGALKDYNKALIIGEKSFGKGSVQKLFDVADGALVKVTVAKWYTPNGNNINGNGITPDRVIVYSETDFNKGIDTQLNAAIAEINK